MARDASLYVRQAGIALLKASAPVTVLVPAARIYPGQRPPNPTWPFIAWGAPTTTPFGASGMDGSTVSVAIHVYAETTGVGDDTVPGEDLAAAILRGIVAALGGEAGAQLSLANTDCPFPATAYITWTGSQVVQDGGDAGAFHGFATFDINVNS